MSDISAIADLLRQREGETDAAWIERLRAVFGHNGEWANDPKADRLGERLWKKLQTGRDKAPGDDT